MLAKEAGIEPGVLDLLKKIGVTSAAELRKKLGIEEELQQGEGKPSSETVEEAVNTLLGEAPAPTPPVPEATGLKISEPDGETESAGGADARHREARRSFISYVAVHPDERERDPDGLDRAARSALEDKAIALILATEPHLQRTPTHNPGFDLFELGANGQTVRWVEVKAMTGSLQDRPVGMSHTQFEHAQKHGTACWLYVVEHAGTDHARIVRIHDPAGKARTFTFDRGWLSIAGVEANQGKREE
jgi:hypothetical protein